MESLNMPGWEDRPWDLINQINDLIAQSDDAKQGVRKGLQAVLNAGGLTGGALLFPSAVDGSPLVIVSCQLTPDWEEELRHPDSHLHSMAVRLLGGSLEFQESRELDLAGAFPLVTSGKIEGVLVLEGACLSQLQREFLTILTPGLARAVLAWRRQCAYRPPNPEQESSPTWNAAREPDQDVKALENEDDKSALIESLKQANVELETSLLELKRSRNTLRALFDNVPSSVYIIDPQYNLTAVNLSRAQRVQLKPRQIVGRKCYEVLYNRPNVCPGCLVSESLVRGTGTNRVRRDWISADLFTEWDISTYTILDTSSQPVQAAIVEWDVTEKRRLEASLVQSEKLAAVGQLAAGVAHEINNPLAAIIANAQILERQLPGDADARESVRLIQLAGARASQVVSNLLDLARKESFEISATDLNLTIRAALILLQHKFASRPIEMVLDLADDLPPIYASKEHLQGIWINLLVNAFDSLEGQPGNVRITSRFQGREFRVTVSDSGKGISTEQVSRIFEPFYTTKDSGRGTGLGLFLCHRAVKQHGGDILVESQVGSGTKFIVVLPAFPSQGSGSVI